MVDFTTPSLPGASEAYNAIAKKVQEVEDKVLTEANLTATASSLTAAIETDLTDLKAKTGLVIPELPTTVPLNLQSELSALTGLTPGSSQYITKLSSITSNFGSSLTANGFSLDTIVSDASSAISDATSALSAGLPSVSASSALSAKVPNFELPPGALEAVEKAKAALLPVIEAVKETASQLDASMTADDVTGIYGDGYSRQELQTSTTSLLGALKSAGEAFDRKAKRIEEALRQSNAQQRQEEEFIDL